MKKLEKNLRKNINTRMTENERSLLRKNIINFIEKYSPENKLNLYREHRHLNILHLFKAGGLVFASFAILFLGGGISYEASLAMPGDALYSLKVNTIEEVRGAFIKSPEEKLLYSQARVAKRIDEVIALAEEGNLTIEKSMKVEKALDAHIADIEEVAKELKDKSPEEFKDTAEAIAPIMEQHKDELKKVNEKVNTKEETKDEAIEKKVIPENTSSEKTLGSTPTVSKADTITKEHKKEESKKAVDSIIAKIEKEADSIKTITEEEKQATPDNAESVKSDQVVKETKKETDIKKEVELGVTEKTPEKNTIQ